MHATWFSPNYATINQSCLKEYSYIIQPEPECAIDCLNSGTCAVTTRRGRRVERCVCPQGYGGTTCQFEY